MASSRTNLRLDVARLGGGNHRNLPDALATPLANLVTDASTPLASSYTHQSQLGRSKTSEGGYFASGSTSMDVLNQHQSSRSRDRLGVDGGEQASNSSAKEKQGSSTSQYADPLEIIADIKNLSERGALATIDLSHKRIQSLPRECIEIMGKDVAR